MVKIILCCNTGIRISQSKVTKLKLSLVPLYILSNNLYKLIIKMVILIINQKINISMQNNLER